MSKQIGIITNDKTQVFQHDVIAGVQKVADSQNYEVVVTSLTETNYDLETISDLAGVLVIANALSDADLAAIYNIGKPMTLVSHRAPQIPIPAVVQNNTDGIRKLVNYLVVECGRKQIAFIRGDMNQLDGKQRELTFQHSMMCHDLLVPQSHLLQGDFIPTIAAKSIQKFIKTNYEFDAVVAADYLMGVAALEVLRAANIAIPDAVCVVGFGDGEEAQAAGLTTVGADVVEMGKRAARQLLAQIEGQRFTGVTWLNTDLIPRKTCKRIEKHKLEV